MNKWHWIFLIGAGVSAIAAFAAMDWMDKLLDEFDAKVKEEDRDDSEVCEMDD